MTLSNRIVHYFKAVGPDRLVTWDELGNVLYRGREDGGPEQYRLNIRQHVHRARKHIPIEGYGKQGWIYRVLPESSPLPDTVLQGQG